MRDPVHLLVSRCLLGEAVRYDGGHKGVALLLALPAEILRTTAVCPEVEGGLPVPREPMGLHGDPRAPRLVGLESGGDLTAALERTIATRLPLPDAAGIDGAVLKSRSPSCAVGTVTRGSLPGGDGLFAEALARLHPALPRVDESALVSPGTRHGLLDAIVAARSAAGRPTAPVEALRAAWDGAAW